MPASMATAGMLGLFVALCVAQVGSLFSADAWNNIGFAAGEVKNPKRDVALGMVLGTLLVTTLYVLANVAYCAAYIPDIPAQLSGFRSQWLRLRVVVFVVGLVFASILARFYTRAYFSPDA